VAAAGEGLLPLASRSRNWDNGHSTAACPKAKRDQPTWRARKKVWKSGFTFKQRNIFCYLCFLPMNDIGFHLDKHCMFNDIVPETLYVLWRSQARTQVEARMGQRWETEAAWRAWLCEHLSWSQCMSPHLACGRVDACRRPWCKPNRRLILSPSDELCIIVPIFANLPGPPLAVPGPPVATSHPADHVTFARNPRASSPDFARTPPGKNPSRGPSHFCPDPPSEQAPLSLDNWERPGEERDEKKIVAFMRNPASREGNVNDYIW
jgi:hypothetical protein